MTEQPPPIPNDNPCSWERVLSDVASMRVEFEAPHGHPANQELAAKVFFELEADMQARDRLGAKRYGTRLQPHNGRDSLRDAYEEALDACVYLANYDAEVGHHNHHGLSRSAIRLAFSIRCRLYARDGR